MVQMLPSEYRKVKLCCDLLMEVANILLGCSGDRMLHDRIQAIEADLYQYLMSEVAVADD